MTLVLEAWTQLLDCSQQLTRVLIVFGAPVLQGERIERGWIGVRMNVFGGRSKRELCLYNRS
jgi:hypothetical protein